MNTLPAGSTVSPLPFAAVRSSDDSNTDIGAQNPATVEAALESSAWFDRPLTFVGGGACGASPAFANGCTAFDNGGGPANKGGSTTFEANVFGIHYGNNFIAVLYAGHAAAGCGMVVRDRDSSVAWHHTPALDVCRVIRISPNF